MKDKFDIYKNTNSLSFACSEHTKNIIKSLMDTYGKSRSTLIRDLIEFAYKMEFDTPGLLKRKLRW